MRRIVVILILYSVALQASEPQNINPIAKIKEQLGSRSLIIFFDPHGAETLEPNKTLPIETAMLFTALGFSSKSAVIASRGLWNNLLACFRSNCLRGGRPLDMSRWHVYTVNDESLLIFIPNQEPFISYLAQLDSFTGGSKKTISDGEILLGIKVNSLKKVDKPLDLPVRVNSHSDDLREYLKKILITYADLKDLGIKSLNSWDLYLSGHGGETRNSFSIDSKESFLANTLNIVGDIGHFVRTGDLTQEGSIAGISLASFGALIDFLNQTVTTRSLLYNTCYGGGEHLRKPYEFFAKDEKRAKELTFMVASATAFDSPTAGLLEVRSGIAPAMKNIDLYFEDLDLYFRKQISSKEELHESKTLEEIISVLTRTREAPVIRFPRTSQFKPLKGSYYIDDHLIAHTIASGKTMRTSAPVIAMDSCYVPIPLYLETEFSMPSLRGLKKYRSYFFSDIDIVKTNVSYDVSDKNPAYSSLSKIVSHVDIDYLWIFKHFVGRIDIRGMCYIEKLRIKCDNVLQSGEREPFMLTELIIDPKNFIAFKYKGNPFTYSYKTESSSSGYHNSYWRGTLDSDFAKAKEAIRKESMLPDAMKSDTPQSSIELTLWHEYVRRKDKPAELAAWRATLREDKQQAIDKWIKQYETYQEMYGDMPELEEV